MNDNNVLSAFVRLQSFNAVKDMADGNATKMIVPSDMQDFTKKTMAFKETDSKPNAD